MAAREEGGGRRFPCAAEGVLTGLTSGSRVAGYLLEKLVGVGGTAAVFRARDERLGRAWR